jgi:hypothetical protein
VAAFSGSPKPPDWTSRYGDWCHFSSTWIVLPAFAGCWSRLSGVRLVIRKSGKLVVFGLLAMLLVAVPVAATMADASAANYHWARNRSRFTLNVGDNVSGNWDRILRGALADWNKNGTVTLDKVSGQTNPQGCNKNTGRVEVCSGWYGTQDNWLGYTILYLDRSGHIEAATVQMNDSFFATNSEFNNGAARRHTMCHELGHAMGLAGHDNNKSCMNNSYYAIFHYVKPIRSDFRELKQIYGHKDSETTVSSASVTGEGFVVPTSLPSAPSEDAVTETVTVQKLDDGRTVVTFITWAKD